MEYVRPQLEQIRFSGGHEKYSLGPRLGEKAWGEKAGGGGEQNYFCPGGKRNAQSNCIQEDQ